MDFVTQRTISTDNDLHFPNGNLASHVFPGGYSINYLTRADEAVCSACADAWIKNSYNYDFEGVPVYFWDEPVLGFVHWEGQDEHCSSCNKSLPSEYGNSIFQPTII